MGNEGKDEGIGLLSGEPATPAPKKTEAKNLTFSADAPTVAPVVPKPEGPSVLMLKAADDTSRDVTAGTVTTLSAVLTSRAVEPVTAALTVEVGYTSTYARRRGRMARALDPACEEDLDRAFRPQGDLLGPARAQHRGSAFLLHHRAGGRPLRRPASRSVSRRPPRRAGLRSA